MQNTSALEVLITFFRPKSLDSVNRYYQQLLRVSSNKRALRLDYVNELLAHTDKSGRRFLYDSLATVQLDSLNDKRSTIPELFSLGRYWSTKQVSDSLVGVVERIKAIDSTSIERYMLDSQVLDLRGAYYAGLKASEKALAIDSTNEFALQNYANLRRKVRYLQQRKKEQEQLRNLAPIKIRRAFSVGN